jgi:Kef-type K+ transport system membrane component KefB
LVLIGFLLAPIFVPRFWMVLLAAAIYSGLAVFIHWNLLSAIADGNGTAQPGIFDLLVPALVDGAVYLAIASGIYLVKRLFVRAQPRQLSNID